MGRRDKAGLGRPEATSGPGPSAGPSGVSQPNKVAVPTSGKNEVEENIKEPAISRDNPFRDAVLGVSDKRSSMGNLFFTDQFDNHPWEKPPELNLNLQPQNRTRRRNASSTEGAESRNYGDVE